MTKTAEMIDPMTGEIVDQKELAEALLEQAREQGVSLMGPRLLPLLKGFPGQGSAQQGDRLRERSP